MAAETGGSEAAQYPREVQPPPGLPPGWKCVINMYRSGVYQGKTYQRYTSPAGQAGWTSVRNCIRQHAVDTGQDPDKAVDEHDRKKEKVIEDKEQDARRKELAGEQFRATLGQLTRLIVEALPGWKTESHYMENCGQTHYRYIDPEGRSLRLLKDVEASLGFRLLENDRVEELTAEIQAARLIAEEAERKADHGGRRSCLSSFGSSIAESAKEVDKRAEFLRAMGKRPVATPCQPQPGQAQPQLEVVTSDEEDSTPVAQDVKEVEAPSSEVTQSSDQPTVQDTQLAKKRRTQKESDQEHQDHSSPAAVEDNEDDLLAILDRGKRRAEEMKESCSSPSSASASEEGGDLLTLLDRGRRRAEEIKSKGACVARVNAQESPLPSPPDPTSTHQRKRLRKLWAKKDAGQHPPSQPGLGPEVQVAAAAESTQETPQQQGSGATCSAQQDGAELEPAQQIAQESAQTPIAGAAATAQCPNEELKEVNEEEAAELELQRQLAAVHAAQLQLQQQAAQLQLQLEQKVRRGKGQEQGQGEEEIQGQDQGPQQEVEEEGKNTTTTDEGQKLEAAPNKKTLSKMRVCRHLAKAKPKPKPKAKPKLKEGGLKTLLAAAKHQQEEQQEEEEQAEDQQVMRMADNQASAVHASGEPPVPAQPPEVDDAKLKPVEAPMPQVEVSHATDTDAAAGSRGVDATPTRKAGTVEGLAGPDSPAASSSSVPKSTQKQPRRGSASHADAEVAEKQAATGAGSFWERWAKSVASNPGPPEPDAGGSVSAAEPSAASPATDAAAAANPQQPETPAATPGSFMERWVRAAPLVAVAGESKPEAGDLEPQVGGQQQEQAGGPLPRDCQGVVTMDAEVAQEEEMEMETAAEMEIGDEQEPTGREESPGDAAVQTEDTQNTSRRPVLRRGSSRRVLPAALPELDVIPPEGLLLPETLCWDASRRTFYALGPGNARNWNGFSVAMLGPRLALARALLHAGLGHMLREAPWSFATMGQSLCDRHTPRFICDLLPYRVWTQLRAWLLRWGRRPGAPRAALVVGRPGCGKSCGVRIIGRLAGRKVTEYSLDDQEGQKFLENVFRKQRTARDVTEGKDGVVMLDVPDEPSPVVKGLLSPAIKASPHPIILTCSRETAATMDAIRKRCLRFEVCPRPNLVARGLEKIVKKEGLGELPESLEAIADASGGNWRGAIARTQLLSVVPHLSSASALSLPALSLPAACDRIMGDSSSAIGIDEVCDLLALDASLVDFVHENHLVSCMANLEEGRALDGCAQAAEALVMADNASMTAEATAWGGVDEGLLAVEGALLAAVRAVPREGGKLRSPMRGAAEPEEPFATPALAARLAQQLGVPKAYVRERATAWLLNKQSQSRPCQPSRFRLWLSNQILRTFHRRVAGLDAGTADSLRVEAADKEEVVADEEDEGAAAE